MRTFKFFLVATIFCTFFGLKNVEADIIQITVKGGGGYQPETKTLCPQPNINVCGVITIQSGIIDPHQWPGQNVSVIYDNMPSRSGVIDWVDPNTDMNNVFGINLKITLF